MDKKFFFISGLPRSGSTLLAGILRQNPDVHAGMSSPVASLVRQMVLATGVQNEYSTFIDDRQREDILCSIFTAYYSATRQPTIFDTNRMWCARMALLASLFQDCKVVACVRDSAWIIDSFERLFRKSPFLFSKMFSPEASGTVISRTEQLTSTTGALGFAWGATQDAFYGEHANRLIVIDYEALTKEPDRTMRALYEFLELPHHQHDFDNVVYEDGGEFDTRFGAPGAGP